MDKPALDITGDVCPFTFVKTKLLVERLPPGATTCVRLQGAAPLRNVPRSLREAGHTVVSLQPEPGQGETGVHRMVIRTAGGDDEARAP